MNVRKIPLSLEVAFWNILIAFLTVFRDMRTFSNTMPAPLPTLRRTSSERLISNPTKWISTNIKIHRISYYKVAIRVCLWAMVGFVMGFLIGLLT